MKVRLLGFALLAGFSSAAPAIQVSVEDVSNQILSCDASNPFLALQPAGSCLSSPDATLRLTITLEANEAPNLLENIHVIVNSNGQNFQYNTKADGSLWQPLPANSNAATLPLTASFQRGPFDTDPSTMVRQVSLDEFYSQKGAKLYVGARANDTAGFLEGSVKEVFEVR